MFTINLHNLIFHSFHGIHEEEKIVGNEFVVNVSLSFIAGEQITTLEQTINYATVYEIVKQRMQIATPLLETLVQDLTEAIRAFDNRIQSISVFIEKKNPPIPNMEGSVSVHYKKDF
ncbi:MAG: dihydroneopterin aldolase [Ferruginibacter sp.]|nr:dihydroneopterin aldolase [Chitinophagaceae bacterium]